jgi:hypothetical protein
LEIQCLAGASATATGVDGSAPFSNSSFDSWKKDGVLLVLHQGFCGAIDPWVFTDYILQYEVQITWGVRQSAARQVSCCHAAMLSCWCCPLCDP